MPSGQQMLSGAKKANKFYQENSNNNNNKNTGLSNLFGIGKK